MMISGKSKISEAELIACMSGLIVGSGLPLPNLGRGLADPARKDTKTEADAEALRKAQEKRERKNAKRLGK